MPPLYALLSLVSIVVFAWAGRRLAASRNRNRTGWTIAGALFPPVLLVLWRLAPRPASPAEDAAA